MNPTLLRSGGEMSLKKPLQEVVDFTSEGEEDAVEKELDHAVEGFEVRGVQAIETCTDDEGDIDSSEADSLMGDICNQLMGSSSDMSEVHGACTAEEAIQYRRMLRTLGPEAFCRVTVEDEKITAKKLLTAFSIRPPEFLEGAEDAAYYPLLGIALQRELSMRRKLDQYNSIDDVVSLLNASKNIIVLTGAGISTSLGIPDFRSKNNGLYPKLEAMGFSHGSEVFEMSLFRSEPEIFYKFATEVVPPDNGRFSPTHAFIKLLQDKKKLLTNYTQNIDNIEEAAGIDREKLIQCHGSWATATCLKCKRQYPGEYIMPNIKTKSVPYCPRGIECKEPHSSNLLLEAPGLKRKRSDNGSVKKRQKGGSDSDADDDMPGPGVIKPDITFFGEALPHKFSDRLTKHDKDLVDLVVVIGTSLKVAPVSEIVPYVSQDTPQIIISRDRVKHVEFDVELLGDADVVVAELCRRLDWKLKHSLIPEGQVVDISLLPDPEGTTELPRPPLKFAHVFKKRD